MRSSEKFWRTFWQIVNSFVKIILWILHKPHENKMNDECFNESILYKCRECIELILTISLIPFQKTYIIELIHLEKESRREVAIVLSSTYISCEHTWCTTFRTCPRKPTSGFESEWTKHAWENQICFKIHPNCNREVLLVFSNRIEFSISFESSSFFGVSNFNWTAEF